MLQRDTRSSLNARLCLLVCLLVLCGGSACVRGVKMPTFPNRLVLAPQAGMSAGVKVVFYGQDQHVVPYVIDAVQRALRVTRKWGGLRSPMTVRIFPTHRSLEEAVLRKFAWLRAWALFHEIYLQTPRTWGIKFYDSALSELLVHEITHVVMYQQCCTLENWRYQAIPFWFREGMASYTAKQGRRRWSIERLALFRRTLEGSRVLERPGRHLRHHQPAAYSLAHWKFEHLVKLCRVAGIKQLLVSMRKGNSYAQALQSACRLTKKAFDVQFDAQLQEASIIGMQGKNLRLPMSFAALRR